MDLSEKQALALRAEVEAIFTHASHPRNFGQDDALNRERERKLHDPENDDPGD